MSSPKTLKRYLAAFALTLTVPVVVVAATMTYHYAVTERTRLEALADNANQGIVSLVEREFSSRVTMLQTLATTRSLVVGDMDRFEDKARDVAQLTGSQIIVFDLVGQQLLNTRTPRGTALPKTADPASIAEVLRLKQPVVSDVFVGSSSGETLVKVSIPIMRDQQVVAVLSSPILLDRLVQLLRDGLPVGPFFATILDRAGNVVARSVNPEKFVGKPFPALADQGRGGTKGKVSFVTSEGVSIFGYYRRPEVSNWMIVAAVDRAALEAPLARSLTGLAVATLALALLAIGGGSWIGARLTRAHKRLATSVAGLHSGRVVEPVATSLHEANVVGRALSAASQSIASHARQLQAANDELEARVRARTRELAEKTALLETTLNTIQQGLIVIDSEGHIPVCNPQAHSMLGLPPEFIDTRPTLKALFGFQSRRGEFDKLPPEQIRRLEPCSDDGVTDLEYERADGSVLHWQTVPIPGGRGFVRTYSDVTQARRHADDLERAKTAAEQANNAKGDFLASMSHEMRTPLNAVIGYSDLLLRQGLDPVARQHVQRIQSAGTALLSLVDDVLDIGKIDAGILDIRAETFSLRSLVDDALALVAPAALNKGLELKLLSPFEAEAFVGDQDRLRQVLLNLLNNAIKFTPSGGIQLSVGHQPKTENTRIVRFAVADTGIGIAPTHRDGLFTRFHQIDGAIDRRFGGVGLGLAIAKQLVERMGGVIGLESVEGHGSTFWFELILECSRTSVSTTAPVAATDHPARTAHILLVEDLALNQELARELLQAAGHTVEIASNGAEALNATQKQVFDVILMDVCMPVMDGITATRHIRANSSVVPIVACTANVLPAKVAAMRDAGVDAYLPKPFRPAQLYEIVDRMVATGRPQNGAQPAAGPEPQHAPCNVISLLGPRRLLAALDELMTEFEELGSSDATNGEERARLAERAHAVISAASLFELTTLAERCRDLENACRDDVGVRQAMNRLRRAIRGSRDTTAKLRRDIERAVA